MRGKACLDLVDHDEIGARVLRDQVEPVVRRVRLRVHGKEARLFGYLGDQFLRHGAVPEVGHDHQVVVPDVVVRWKSAVISRLMHHEEFAQVHVVHEAAIPHDALARLGVNVRAEPSRMLGRSPHAAAKHLALANHRGKRVFLDRLAYRPDVDVLVHDGVAHQQDAVVLNLVEVDHAAFSFRCR